MINLEKTRARARLDARLATLKPENRYAVPPKGWVRAIRDALGMTGGQLGARLGVRPQSIQDLEASEAAGTIQLKSLRRAAEALDCTLVYALVPNTSLEDMVETRARAIARRDLGRVSHSMALENQGFSDVDLDERIKRYIDETLRERDLWNEE